MSVGALLHTDGAPVSSVLERQPGDIWSLPERKLAIRYNLNSVVVWNRKLLRVGIFGIFTLSAQSSALNPNPNTASLQKDIALGTDSTTVSAGSPFFMFSTANPSDAGVFPVLETYFQSIDYVSVGVATADPSLAQQVGNAHQYQLPPSLSSVQTQTNNGCSTGIPGLIIYDIEH